ncbi:MAG: hypothetical protein ACI4UK_09550 [Floccifex sp.]
MIDEYDTPIQQGYKVQASLKKDFIYPGIKEDSGLSTSALQVL